MPGLTLHMSSFSSKLILGCCRVYLQRVCRVDMVRRDPSLYSNFLRWYSVTVQFRGSWFLRGLGKFLIRRSLDLSLLTGGFLLLYSTSLPVFINVDIQRISPGGIRPLGTNSRVNGTNPCTHSYCGTSTHRRSQATRYLAQQQCSSRSFWVRLRMS